MTRRSSDNGHGHTPKRLPGVHEYSSREFREKFGREHVPAAFYTLERAARAADGEEGHGRERVFVVPAGEDLRHDLSHGTDAVNHLLALLNFPASLRAFVDCMVGLAGERAGWFEEYGVTVGRRARTGEDDCTDASMERWVQRQKARLRQWQFERNFRLVEMQDGGFDQVRRKNKPTKWRVPLVGMAAEVVLRARAKAYWPRGPRHQSRALREAARELLTEDPEAPPVTAPLPRTLTDEELLNRALKTVETQLGVIRDVLLRNGGDPQALLAEKYAAWMEKMGADPPGDDGDDASPPTSDEGPEPVVEEGGGGDIRVAPSAEVPRLADRRSGRGDTGVAPSPASHSPPPMGSGSRHDGSLLRGSTPSGQGCARTSPAAGARGDTTCTTTTEEALTTSSAGRLHRVKERVRRAMAELARRYPEPSVAMKRRGCVEIVWGDATQAAARAEAALDEAISAWASGEADEVALEAAWTEFVLSRARRWRELSPRPARTSDVVIPRLVEEGGRDEHRTGEA